MWWRAAVARLLGLAQLPRGPLLPRSPTIVNQVLKIFVSLKLGKP